LKNGHQQKANLVLIKKILGLFYSTNGEILLNLVTLSVFDFATYNTKWSELKTPKRQRTQNRMTTWWIRKKLVLGRVRSRTGRQLMIIFSSKFGHKKMSSKRSKIGK
jgi:hypothetical protein